MARNTHFSIDAWVDFARGLCGASLKAEMQRHKSSCTECSELADFLMKLWKVGRRLPENTAPEVWSRKAERIMQVETLAPVHHLPNSPAELVFDSLNALVPAEVRSASPSGRHLVYETTDCALDLKLETDPDSAQDFSIVGQIRDRRVPDKAIPLTPVYLLAGQRVIATTSSNEFGEFRVDCRSRRKLRISFPFDGWRIDVKLDPLANEEARSE